MAQLLLINEMTYRPGSNNIGDIVAIMPDTHEFSDGEKSGFTILKIPYTVAQVNTAISKLLPYAAGMTQQDFETKYSKPSYPFNVKNALGTKISDIIKANVVTLNG